MSKNILIKNIYYMLAYAFQSLLHTGFDKLEKEDFDDIHNLFSAILAQGIGLQLKQGLYREYLNKHENLHALRGKIDMPETIKNKMAKKKIIGCDYDELSENNLLNQILKTTSMLLIRHQKVKSEHQNQLRKRMLFFSHVDTLEPTSIRWQDIRFQRHNRSYRMLLQICQLVIEGMLLTTDKGEYKLASFIDEQQMFRLYEKFILNYYSKHFPMLNPSPAAIKWALDDEMDTMLPGMYSDVTLSNKNDVLILDAKYMSSTTQERFERHGVHSGNLYQIFTYVKNKQKEEIYRHRTVSGLLLYARTTAEIQPDQRYQMSGNTISVKTLDLNVEFKEIAAQLDAIVKEHFKLEVA